MRSSEVSGAGALGFRAGQLKAKDKRTARFGNRSVALTAFAAAALFIVYDANTLLTNGADGIDAIGALVAAELAAPAPDVIASVANASMMTASPPPDALTATPDTAVLTEIVGHGAIALGLAGLASFFATRRRRDEDVSEIEAPVGSYESLCSAIPMGLACWTGTGEMIVCNAEYRAHLDHTSGQLRYKEAVNALIDGGHMNTVSDDDNGRLLELYRGDGTCLLIDERPLDDGGFMTLVSDITERKRTEAMLETIRHEQRLLARKYHEEKLKAEAASRAKTNFLAHLSHDIRTPLNHIIGFADLMQMQISGPLGDERYVEYSRTIKNSGEILLNSFAAILDLAELEGGQKALRHDPVLLDEVVQSVVARFKPQTQRAGIHFIVGPHTGAVLRGDRLGLTRMLGNIMDNAVRFTKTGGQITLATFAADDGVVIEISDTGIGMSEERLSTLSQPFAMGDATFTRTSGPGLGISIARAIAELSGGHIAIDSSPSLGTTVAISLPLDAAAAQLAA
ncbi:MULTISPECIES: PAS domain-containing sensor histidine kinase [unclassified Devosia]|uniref:sensor histidine kinase n=1 Tax=unclassified Devosia TaxID=196773 RepID=UPI00145D808C|nr:MULTISPECIES: PAS domain-containing sensor histidine kinase [unclassified Devosia]MBJ6987327.1 PAS-domain containing protein [Devosia sp. MC521]QMW63503.1 PAS-domain containing protein [Devosia sp. MC521]